MENTVFPSQRLTGLKKRYIFGDIEPFRWESDDVSEKKCSSETPFDFHQIPRRHILDDRTLHNQWEPQILQSVNVVYSSNHCFFWETYKLDEHKTL
jgi:hypothetical protein